jgi:mRNA interferase RelE/StbE
VPYTIEFLRSAVRELETLPKSRQKQIATRIDGLRDSPFPPGVKKLEGEDKLYRLRVGDYRILYEVDDSAKKLTVAKIGHRREIYRNL